MSVRCCFICLNMFNIRMVLFRLDLGAPDSRQRRCSHGSCDRPAAARSLSAAIEGHTQNAWAANLDGAYVSCSPRYQKVISAPAGEPKLRPPKRWFAASGCCQRLQASKAAASLWGAASFQRQSSSERKQCSTAQPSKAIRPAAALGLYARAASSAPQHSRFLRADRA